MQATGTDWKRMQDGYRRSIGDRIAEVRSLLEALSGDEHGAERDRLDALRRDLHKLHGSAGTWGFGQVGEVAGRIETLVGGWVDGGTNRPVETQVDALRAELEALEAAAATGPEGNGAVPLGVHALLVHDDPEVRGMVWETVSTRGWRLETADSVEAAVSRSLAGVQLIAVGGGGSAAGNSAWISKLREAARGVPIVALLETNSATERIAAAGAGADLVLAGPHDGHALFDGWARLLSPTQVLGERVLLIDDDPGFQKFLRTALESWGLEVEVLDDPLQVFARAADAPPDLLILDLEMPTARGPEILRALRSSPEWRDLPAVVVTGHEDPHRRLEAFEAGADRVLVKPVRAHELKAAVLAGVRRGRSLDVFSAAPSHRGTTAEVDVYLIEDDTALLEMLEYALTNRGFRCQAFTNGREALDALLASDTQDRKPVVLLDVDLPGLDGFSALQQIHRARPGDFQIVIVTVHSGEREQIKALRCGAADYLVKPVSIPVVVAKVERLFRPGGAA